MKKITKAIFIICLAFWSLSVFANSSALIFHATRAGTSFYIVGTKHDVAFSELLPSVQEFLENRIKESKILIVESIAPANNNIEEFISLLQELDAFHDVEISHNEIFAELLRQVKVGLASRFNIKGDLDRLSYLKTWAILMTASYISLQERTVLGFDSEIARKFIQSQIAKGTSSNDIKYFGLETRKDFVSAFANKTFKKMSAKDLENQAQYLLEKRQLSAGGKDYSYREYSENFYDISNAYDRGEIKQIFKTSTDARNKNWVKNVQILIDNGSLINKNLMAVGLSHLLGSHKGLLALLIKNGFEVEKFDDENISRMNQLDRCAEIVRDQSALTGRIAEALATIAKAAEEERYDDIAKLFVEYEELDSKLKSLCDILKESN